MSAQGSTHIETRRAAAHVQALHLHLPVQLKCHVFFVWTQSLWWRPDLRILVWDQGCLGWNVLPVITDPTGSAEPTNSKLRGVHGMLKAVGFCLALPFTYRTSLYLPECQAARTVLWVPGSPGTPLPQINPGSATYQFLFSEHTGTNFSEPQPLLSAVEITRTRRAVRLTWLHPHWMHFVFTRCSLSTVRGDTHSLHLCHPLPVHTSYRTLTWPTCLEEYLLEQLLTFPNAAPPNVGTPP